MARDDVDRRLAEIPLFSACSAKELRQISSLTTLVQVPAGRVLAEEGQLGLEFVVVVSGTATVTKQGEPVQTLGAGDWFGEIALLEDHVRSATVTADTDMEIEVVDRAAFGQLLEEHPSIALVLLRGLARIVASYRDV